MIRCVVESRSGPDLYEVVGDIMEDEMGNLTPQFHCDCPGCAYRGDCRHTTLVQRWLTEGLRMLEATEG